MHDSFDGRARSLSITQMSYSKLPDPQQDSYNPSTSINIPIATKPIPSGRMSSAPIASPSNSYSQPQPQTAANTLDEPIKETIMRDVRNIWCKIKQVLDPRPNKDENLLKDWDW